jgi:hypothetical protein
MFIEISPQHERRRWWASWHRNDPPRYIGPGQLQAPTGFKALYSTSALKHERFKAEFGTWRL